MSSCVDVHSHFFPAAILDTLRKDGARYGTSVTVDGEDRIFLVTPERAYGPLGPGFYDLDVRRQFLARQGITTQVLCAPPFVFYYSPGAGARHLRVRAHRARRPPRRRDRVERRRRRPRRRALLAVLRGARSARAAGPERFHLRNLVGFPLDTTLAAARLIFSGVLARFPRLRICLGQAVGFLPYVAGRLDHGHAVRPECRRQIGAPPSEYLGRFRP